MLNLLLLNQIIIWQCSSPLFDRTARYRKLIGKLIYISITRPELAYNVHILAQFMHTPRKEHWEEVIKVVRYLKGRPRQSILLKSDSSLTLIAYSDSDWASCLITRSVRVFYFFV